MNFLGLLFWVMVTEKLASASDSKCSMHDKCLNELRKFTQSDEFHVYASLEEAEKACGDAKDAYLCVQSAPDCRDPSENVKLSPLIRGSSRLLKAFCGFRSKRRPCCALRKAYLEHSSCYQKVNQTLNICNEKYRKSLDVIFTMQTEQEQKEQRFCSVKWFGNCVKKATQSCCGKVAAQIIKTYVTKAGKPETIHVRQNEKCHGNLYGYEEGRNQFCEPKNFQRCRVHLLFLHEYLVEDRFTDDEKFLSVCGGVHDSLECLKQTFNRCVSSQQRQIIQGQQGNEMKNGACQVKENVLQKYRGKVHCLTEHVQELLDCKPENLTTADYFDKKEVGQKNEQFCGLLRRLETCWIKKAGLLCGDSGKRVMSDILQIAAIDIHYSCSM